jgi:hypothetical protein
VSTTVIWCVLEHAMSVLPQRSWCAIQSPTGSALRTHTTKVLHAEIACCRSRGPGCSSWCWMAHRQPWCAGPSSTPGEVVIIGYRDALVAHPCRVSIVRSTTPCAQNYVWSRNPATSWVVCRSHRRTPASFPWMWLDAGEHADRDGTHRKWLRWQITTCTLACGLATTCHRSGSTLPWSL